MLRKDERIVTDNHLIPRPFILLRQARHGLKMMFDSILFSFFLFSRFFYLYSKFLI